MAVEPQSLRVAELEEALRNVWAIASSTKSGKTDKDLLRLIRVECRAAGVANVDS